MSPNDTPDAPVTAAGEAGVKSATSDGSESNVRPTATAGEKTPAERVPAERIPAEQRREQILAAASHVFGERGYAGSTTDQVAQEAGISQPYVVRMFGTKENLFVEVLDRALGKLTTAFRTAIADSKAADEDLEARGARIGAAYADLIADRGILLALMQAFLMGSDRVIGQHARDGFLEIYDIMRNEAGLEPDDVVGFLAHGMLFNTLAALRMTDAYGSSRQITELVECTFKNKLDVVLGALDRTPAGNAE